MERTILLNVYDLSASNGACFNDALNPLGLGFYHSGVELSGLEYEYSFSTFGIQRSKPRLPQFGRLREQINMGTFVGTLQDINVIINRLTEDGFKGTQYDVIRNNCNAFSERFCVELVGKSIPAWVNRAASIGQGMGIQQPVFPVPPVPSATASSAPTSSSSSQQQQLQLQSPDNDDTKSTSIFSWVFGGWGNNNKNSNASQPLAGGAAPMKKKLTEQQKQLLDNLKKK